MKNYRVRYAVKGNTYNIKDKLKDLGATWVGYKNCWVFNENIDLSNFNGIAVEKFYTGIDSGFGVKKEDIKEIATIEITQENITKYFLAQNNFKEIGQNEVLSFINNVIYKIESQDLNAEELKKLLIDILKEKAKAGEIKIK